MHRDCWEGLLRWPNRKTFQTSRGIKSYYSRFDSICHAQSNVTVLLESAELAARKKNTKPKPNKQTNPTKLKSEEHVPKWCVELCRVGFFPLPSVITQFSNEKQCMLMLKNILQALRVNISESPYPPGVLFSSGPPLVNRVSGTGPQCPLCG